MESPVKALVGKTISGKIFVLGPNSVTMTATLANGDPLPSFITYDSSSGELSIWAVSTTIGSYTVIVTGTRETVSETQTIQIEAW
jgi:hypothetical protein